MAQAIKSQRPDVPVGLITGWGNELDEAALSARGIDVLVSKPVRLNDVLAAVDSALRHKR